MGPGVLILSHERYNTRVVHSVEIDRATMDVSNSIYNAIGDACSMVLHMRVAGEAKRSRTAPRCLASVTSDEEEAKDNLGVVLPHYPNGIIPFTTEKNAVEKLMGCFDGKGAMKKTKKVKKSKKKTKRKETR